MERPQIFRAQDHQSFLKEMFFFQKENISAFSYAFCAQRMKVSVSYLKNVLSRKRKLSLEHAFNTCEVFKLTPLEQRYFLLMVIRDQTKDTQTSAYFEEILATINWKETEIVSDSVFKNASHESDVLADPLVHLVLSLVALEGFSSDLKWLKEHINDRTYTETQITDAFSYLLTKGIVAHEDGRYVIKNDCVSTPNPFDPNSFKVYRTGLIQVDRALDDLLEFRPCNFFMINCSVNQRDMLKIVDTFSKCREEIMAIVQESTEATHVVAISNNLITVSGHR